MHGLNNPIVKDCWHQRMSEYHAPLMEGSTMVQVAAIPFEPEACPSCMFMVIKIIEMPKAPSSSAEEPLVSDVMPKERGN
jgi:hypothetical protein